MPNTDHVAALQYAALTLQRLARERSADASTLGRSTTTLAIAADVAQAEADALDAGSQALAALWREALGRDVDDVERADHLERARDAALRAAGRFTL